MNDTATTTGDGSLRERQKARNRAAIVRSAQAAFIETGFAATSLNEIAQRAELSPRTVANYYADKRALFRASLSEGLLAMHDEIAAILARPAPFESTLRSCFDACFEWVAADPVTHSVIRSNLPYMREYLDLSMFDELVGRLLEHRDLADAGDSGNVDRAFLAIALTSLVLDLGQVMLYRDAGDVRPAAEFASAMAVGGIRRICAGGAPLDVGAELAQEVQELCKASRRPRGRPAGLREQRKAKNRESIVAAASVAFAERGYVETGIREIGRRAGLSPGTLYGYFSDKEEILFALVDAYCAVQADQVAMCRERATSLEELNAAQFRLAFGITVDDPQLWAIFSANLSEVLRVMPMLENMQRYVTEFMTDARKQMDEGYLPEVDADFLAVSVFGIGFALSDLIGRRDAPDCSPGSKFATDFFVGGLLSLDGEDPYGDPPPYGKLFKRR